MLTSPEQVLLRDDRPAYRLYHPEVARVTSLSPSFTRITFTCDEFETFGTDLLDQRIKIFFPLADIGITDLGEGVDWYPRWRALPAEQQNPFRTFTVRAVRQQSREVDVDFVSHGDGGPAARWLMAAAPGDRVALVGPNALSINSAIGIDWHPGSATDVLLAGDETATPAICSILESLPAGVRATAFIEVPKVADAVEITRAADVTITWLGRDAGGQSLEAAVRGWVEAHPHILALSPVAQVVEDVDVDLELIWDAPIDTTGSFYAWLAGESSVIKSLRRLLVTDRGVDRKQVAFMGYWRLGKSEGQ
jgi:NADPH-dependent ferric siderophore reductase